MPLPELLDELFRLYRRHFSLIIGVALLVALPGLVWQLVTGSYRLTVSSYANLFSNPGSATPAFSSQQLQNLSGAYALAGLGALILLPFSIGAVARAVTDVALGRPANVGSVLRETLARYFPLLGLIALVFVIFVVWVIAFAIGLVIIVLPGLAVLCAGIFFAVRWSLTVAAMMAEDIGPIRAFGRSWNLVKGMWWRTFGIIFIAGVAYSILTLALLALFNVVAAIIPGLSTDFRSGLATAATTLVDALIAPIFPVVLTLLYFDLRVRKEGLDLDQLAQQTSPGPAPA